jgi:DNA-directed RNA polymerase specialized sigma24 family protein
MAEIQDTSREDAGLRREGEAMTPSELDEWFAREILPLESTLMRFLQHNWHNWSDITDLRQEVYIRVCEAALKQIPEQPRQFVFTTARNLLIDRVRRERVIPIEAVEDLDALGVAIDEPGAERRFDACGGRSTVCLRAAARPSYLSRSTDCRGRRSRSAWAFPTRWSPSISPTG